jgi:hypothetical protein
MNGKKKRGITVHVVTSTETIDLEAWVRDYVRALFESKGYTIPTERAA